MTTKRFNKQKIFDRVATHLLTQNAKAKDGSACQYRAPGNRSCAVGCLIPDNLYDASIEGVGITHILDSSLLVFSTDERKAAVKKLKKLIRGAVGATKESDFCLLRDLQVVHDDEITENWGNELRTVAHKHNLNTNALPCAGEDN
jgi:hypothetical protein